MVLAGTKHSRTLIFDPSKQLDGGITDMKKYTRYDSTHWSKADSWFILAIIIGAILLEILFGSPVKGDTYYYSPPASPMEIKLDLLINGIKVDFSSLACSESVPATECKDAKEANYGFPLGFDVKAYFKGEMAGYLCKPRPGSAATKERSKAREKYLGSSMPVK